MPKELRYRMLAAVALLVVVGGVVLAARSTSDSARNPETAPSTIPEAQVGTETKTAQSTALPAPLQLPSIPGLQEINAGPHPDWLTFAGGSTWIAGVGDENGTTIGRYDTASGELRGTVRFGTDTIPANAVPAVCTSMEAGFDSVWVVDCPAKTMTRIDAESGAVLATIALPIKAVAVNSTIAVGAGGVFVLSSGEGRNIIWRIDPTNALSAKIWAPESARALCVGEGSLWVSSGSPGAVTRMDPNTGATIATIETNAGERFLTVGAGSVWALNENSSVVSRIDPATNSIVATVQVSNQAFGGGEISFGGGYLWSRVSDALVAQVDPATNQVIARYGEHSDYGGARATEDELWISSATTQQIWRVPLS